MNALGMYREFIGVKFGSMEAALADFRARPLAEQDRFCGALADHLASLEDPAQAREFMQARLDGIGLVVKKVAPRDDLAQPEGLSPLGRRARAAIMAVLKQHDATDTGGGRAFYSPAEWRDRGERYGRKAELIVTYDGGEQRPFFNMDAAEGDRYDRYEEMRAQLAKEGLYFEECTGWYAAVYPI